MSHDHNSVRAYQRRLIRERYERDPKVREVRYVMEEHMRQGDNYLAFRRGMPEARVVDAIRRIGEGA